MTESHDPVECCMTCYFMRNNECRRHAPTLVQVPFIHVGEVMEVNPRVSAYPSYVTQTEQRFTLESKWPAVEMDDWCGLYERNLLK